MGICNDGKSKITATAAREIANVPTKLVNIISRNIKEQAELGSGEYVFTGEITEKAIKYVEQTFRKLGFGVRVFRSNNEIPCAKDATYTVSVCTFVFKW